jgi:hypothetical protein
LPATLEPVPIHIFLHDLSFKFLYYMLLTYIFLYYFLYCLLGLDVVCKYGSDCFLKCFIFSRKKYQNNIYFLFFKIYLISVYQTDPKNIKKINLKK